MPRLQKVRCAACAPCLVVAHTLAVCACASRYTRAYLHLLMKTDSIGPQLISYHNIAYMMTLTRSMRKAIIDGT